MDTNIKDKILKRHILTILGFFGFLNVYALRVNLSVAIVSMVNSTASHHGGNLSDECPYPNISANSTQTTGGKFDWDSKMQGLILGGFFYGYIFTQIPGGMLAERFGGKLVFGLGVLCTGLFTLLTPAAAELGPY